MAKKTIGFLVAILLGAAVLAGCGEVSVGSSSNGPTQTQATVHKDEVDIDLTGIEYFTSMELSYGSRVAALNVTNNTNCDISYLEMHWGLKNDLTEEEQAIVDEYMETIGVVADMVNLSEEESKLVQKILESEARSDFAIASVGSIDKGDSNLGEIYMREEIEDITSEILPLLVPSYMRVSYYNSDDTEHSEEHHLTYDFETGGITLDY